MLLWVMGLSMIIHNSFPLQNRTTRMMAKRSTGVVTTLGILLTLFLTSNCHVLRKLNFWRILALWSLLSLIICGMYKSKLVAAFVKPNLEITLREINDSLAQVLLSRTQDTPWPYGAHECLQAIFNGNCVCMCISMVLDSFAPIYLTDSKGRSVYKMSDESKYPFISVLGISKYYPEVLGVPSSQLDDSEPTENIRPFSSPGGGLLMGGPPLGMASALTASKSGIDDDEEALDPATMPYFDYGVARNITTVVGQHAFILCRVHRMNERSVSWIRKRDLHILTAGPYTYTTDQRFVVLHPEKSENWTLQIKYPQVRDSGVYECQVNTEPKISMAFHLSVIESRARVIGSPDIHVQSGSSLRLTCEVEHSPHDIAQVFWYHNAKIIDPQGMYGEALTSGIQIVTQRSDILRSQLTIVKVRSNHSGNYTCSPTMSISSSVIVHVISGEHPAERLQRGNGSSSSFTHLRSFEYFILYASLRFFMLIHSICIKDCVESPR